MLNAVEKWISFVCVYSLCKYIYWINIACIYHYFKDNVALLIQVNYGQRTI